MIATITRGADFRDLLRYVMDPRHDPALVATNLAGEDASTLAWELTTGERERRHQGRPDVGRPVVHISLSLAHEDRRLSQAELSVLAERFLERMGYAGCAFVAVEHNDRQHQHVHLVVSRVRSDGSLAREQLGDFHKAMEVCRQLEREFGLRRLEAERDRAERQPGRDEYRHSQRTQQLSDRVRLQQLVAAAISDRPTLTRFVEGLAKEGVEVRLTLADDGPVLGISYRLERIAFKGRSLGPGYTWPGLLRQGLDYDAQRDREAVARVGRSIGRKTPVPPRAEVADRVRRAIDEALGTKPSLIEFAAALEVKGIGVRLNTAQTGHVSGITFVLPGHAFKGSELDRSYSWLSLQRRGLHFDPAREGETAHRLAGGGEGGGRKAEPGLTEIDRARLAADEARRQTPEYAKKLLERAPKEALIRDRGDLRPSRNLDSNLMVARIRRQTLGRAQNDFADEPQTPGLSLYPTAGYIEEGQKPTARELTHVDGYASIWRDRSGEVVGAAFVDLCLGTVDVPEHLRQGFADYNDRMQTPARREFMEWWQGHHHLLEAGYVGGIAVDDERPRDLTRQAVKEMQVDLARHRVDRRLSYERDRIPSSLTTEGARSLNAQRADLTLTSAIAQAAVRNPDALQRLVRMPDTGRPLTQAELLRGVMDVADGGGRQFHVEALAVKQAVRPLARDPEAFRRAFGFDLVELPPQPILCLGALPDGRHELHLEDVFGRRLEEHNVRVEGEGREGAEGVRGAPGAGREDDSGRPGSRIPEGGEGGGDGGGRHAAPGEALPLAPPDPARRQATAEELALARGILDRVLLDRPALGEFIERARAQGLSVRIYQQPDGQVFAVGYRLGSVVVRPKALGPQYGWKTLVASRISFDPARDAKVLARVGRVIDEAARKPPRDRAKPASAGPDEAAIARLAALVAEARADKPTFTTFVARLQAAGVEVRLYNLKGEPFALGYAIDGPGGRIRVRARQLGPGNGWKRLLREGLDFDPMRDAATIAQVIRRIENLPPDRLGASARDREHVRAAVKDALAGGATLTEFVQRVEARGVEVRLFKDVAGQVHSVGYGLPNAFIRGRDLGPGQRWQRLLREGLDFDPVRDAAALHKVSETVARTEERERTRPVATAEQLEDVRQSVRAALQGGATLAEFVDRVEARGVEVRLWRDEHGGIVAIGYGLGAVSVAGADLGPGHSWPRLLREGLDLDPVRDAEALCWVSEALPTRDWEPSRATPEQLAFVRETVREAYADRPTFETFAQRVEGRGIEVRLYRTEAGDVYAIGFGLGRVNVSGQELGPGFRLGELFEYGLQLDPSRDRAAVDRVAATLTPAKSTFHQVLHTADRFAYLTISLSSHLQMAQELVEDPVGGLGRAAGRLAWSLAVSGAAEVVREASRSAAEALSQERDRALLDAARASRSGEDIEVSRTTAAAMNRDADSARTAVGDRRSDEYSRAQASAEAQRTGERDGSSQPDQVSTLGREGPAASTVGPACQPDGDGRRSAAAEGRREVALDAHREEARGDEGPARVPGEGRGGSVQAGSQRDADGPGRLRGDAAQGRGGREEPVERTGGAQETACDRDGHHDRGEEGPLGRGREVQERGLSGDPVVHQDAGDPDRGRRGHDRDLAPAAPAAHDHVAATGARNDRAPDPEALSRSDDPRAAVEHRSLTADRQARHVMENAAAAPAPAPAVAPAPQSQDLAASRSAEHARTASEPVGRGLMSASAAGGERRSEEDPAKLILAAAAEFDRGMAAATEEGRARAQQLGDSGHVGPAQQSEHPARLIMEAVEESRRTRAADNQEASRQPQQAQDPADRIRAALDAAKRETIPTSDARQALLRAGANAGELVAGALQHVPSPGRTQDLAESPEKSAVAGVSTVASLALPKAAPVVGTVANQIEKQIDRSSEPERTR